MMNIQTDPTIRKKNRKFGFTVAAGLGMFIIWHYYKHHQIYLYFLLSGSLMVMLSLMVPDKLAFIRKYWEKLGHILGVVNTHILLTLIFFLLLLPTSLLLKLFHKDILGKRIHPQMQSYWETKSIPGNSKLQF